MSHQATKWLSEEPTGILSNAEFRVLFVLCDCHNPKRGCFPKQSYIMDKTGKSSSSINSALSGLEQKGFIRRERRVNKRTGIRQSTCYRMKFEDLPQEETSTPDGARSISGKARDPSPVSVPSQLRNAGDTYKEEPVKEPVKEPCAAGAAQSGSTDFDKFFAEFRAVYPRIEKLKATEKALRSALDEGAKPETVLSAARAYAELQAGNKLQYIKHSNNWAAERLWEDSGSSKMARVVDQKTVLEARARDILAAKPYISRLIKPHAAGECILAGLVTVEDCRRAGISV